MERKRFDELLAEIVTSPWTGFEATELAGFLLVANSRFNQAVTVGELVPPSNFDELLLELEDAIVELEREWLMYRQASLEATRSDWPNTLDVPKLIEALTRPTVALRRILGTSPQKWRLEW